MDVKTYRAPSMQQALELVRRELGPAAAVLHTREVRAGGFFALLPGLRRIEVTASANVVVPSRLPARMATTKAESEDRPRVSAPAPAVSRDNSRLREADEARSRADFPRFSPRSTDDSLADDLRAQLAGMRAMMEDLRKRSMLEGQREWPEETFELYTRLIDAEIGEESARDLIQRARLEAESSGRAGRVPTLENISRLIESDLRTRGGIRVEPNRRRLVALVGPTGVGKTTTIAKLAANFRLRDKRRVGLITVDTYRIAAVEQLRTYAEIIDLPMEVVSTPREMRDATRRMADLDLVLLDTAGRSPKDEVKIRELKAFLSEAEADEVHLVLSSAASAATLARTAERFGLVGTTALILTKLDEAMGLGNILPFLRTCELPLSYLTDGQSVPDDIAPADSRRLARALLGLDESSLEERLTAGASA